MNLDVEERLAIQKGKSRQTTTTFIPVGFIPAISVSVERAFSRGKFLLRELRQGLSPQLLEAMIACYWNEEIYIDKGDQKLTSILRSKKEHDLSEARADFYSEAEESEAEANVADFNLRQDLRNGGNISNALRQLESTREEYNAELTTDEAAAQLLDQSRETVGGKPLFEPVENLYANGFNDEEFMDGFIKQNRERRAKKKRELEAAEKARKKKKTK